MPRLALFFLLSLSVAIRTFSIECFAQSVSSGAGGFDAYSVEEAMYLIDSVPPGFNFSNKQDIPFYGIPSDATYKEILAPTTPLQSPNWQALSLSERMLTNGYEVLSPENKSYEPKRLVHPVTQLGHMLYRFYLRHGRMPESQDELWVYLIDTINKASMGDSSVNRIQAISNALERMKSPVTGKLIEWNHPEFSAGNAYVVMLNENEEWVRIAASHFRSSLEGPDAGILVQPPRGLDFEKDFVYFYFRAYGTSGVLHTWFAAWPKQK